MKHNNTFPTLFKRTATGAVQQWSIEWYPVEIQGFGEVRTTYGQVGGALQVTTDLVKEGKNLGKANATTALEQAQLQAKQQWEKKRKQGYVENLTAAIDGDTGLDGVKPMLAHVYEDHLKKVQWPARAQPKLDGMRCIAVVKDGVCKLYSRTQKPITTMPHIVEAVESLVGGEYRDFVLDGELYNHALKHDFNRIMSIIKRDEVHEDHQLVQYHVYDMPSHPGGFTERWDTLRRLVGRVDLRDLGDRSINLVRTVTASSEAEMQEIMSWFIEDGYEGLMYRRPDSKYEGKRSHGLLKVKTFRDAEFEAVDVEEGNGKLQGKAGAIWCLTPDGQRFKAKMQGSLDGLAEYLVNKDKYIGRQLTVRYQNLTPAGIPRFPVGIRFREAE